MMFTMAKLRDAATYLSAHLSANDYFCESETVAGMWRGIAATILGIEGRPIGPKDAAFERLRQNRHPQTGERLTERTARDRIAFFDFQLSAPKSVSLLAVTFADSRLREAHELAAREAFAFLERFSARRLRKGAAAWSEETRFTGNLCAAIFLHDASRALDAQLHTHHVVVNATYDETDRCWTALTEVEILRAIRCCGKVYQSALARRVVECGYTLEITRDAKGQITGFEIEGVTESDRATASRRRADIDAAILEFEVSRGRRPTKKEVDQIVRETRDEKLAEITTAEVRLRQLQAFSDARRAALHRLVDQAKSRLPAMVLASVESALSAARDHVFERDSVIPAHALIAEALNENLGALEPGPVIRAVVSEKAGICLLSRSDLAEASPTSSREGLNAELSAIRVVNEGRGVCDPLGPPSFDPPAFLSASQRGCVLGVLDSRDTITALRGLAGAGKTTTLQAIHAGFRASGTRSYYCAPTASAVDVLRSEGFGNAMTLAAFLLGSRDGDLRGAVIVVDEAGLISCRQGAALLQLAQREGARVLLVGDARQHSAVEAGDFLALLETHSSLRSHELTDIRRQTVAAYRAAIQTLARGDARTGLLALDALGFVHAAGDDYIARAAEAYLGHKAENAIIVAPTWAEIDAVTDEIRTRRLRAGELSDEKQRDVCRSLKWTATQKRKASNYQPGQVLSVHAQTRAPHLAPGSSLEVISVSSDLLHVRDDAGQVHLLNPGKASAAWDVGQKRTIKLAAGDQILIQQNLKTACLVNGDVLCVRAIGADGAVTASNKAGETRTIPATFRAFTYGYAVTSHKSQGRTADHVVICAARLDAKATYVAFSRGRKSAACYTPDKEALIAGLPLRASSRPAALDYLRRAPSSRIARAQRRTRTRTWLHLLILAARRAARAARSLLRSTPRR
jgi:conjugative relaxase-like TrwC/TraI family protein